MNILKFFILITIVFCSNTSFSQSKTQVACTSSQNYKIWRWAKDSTGKRIEVPGYWKLHKEKKIDYAPKYFFITTEDEIERIKQFCGPNDFLQAADSWYSNWYRFAFVINTQPFEIEIEPGYWGWHDKGILQEKYFD